MSFRVEQVHLALSMSDGSVAVMGFVTRGLQSPARGKAGDVTVLDPSGGAVEAVVFEREVSERTVQEECAKAFEGKGVHMVSWRLLASAPDLADEYRNAWFDDGAAITHRMPQAKDLYRDRLRQRRLKLFEQLDVEVRDADEALFDAPDDAQAKRARRRLARKRKRLKDAPADPRIEACQSIEQLRALDVLADVDVDPEGP